MIRQSSAASRPNRPANRKAAPFSKQSFAHAFRVIAPTLVALTFASAAHCARNDGLLGRSDAYGNVQNVRYICGCCHLLRRPHLRRHSDDEWSIPGCHSRPLRCAFRCRCSWLGRGLDRLPYRPEHVGAAMHTTKRGEPLPINQALNRPRGQARA